MKRLTLAALSLAAWLPVSMPLAADEDRGPAMKPIPAGRFTMGTDDGRSMPNERPAYTVELGRFWLDEHPVTNAEFARFVRDSRYVTTAERPVDWNEIEKQLPPGAQKSPAEMLQPGSLVFSPPEEKVDLRFHERWWAWTWGASWKHPEGQGSGLNGRESHPVVHVSWDDARAYCSWADKRLPTEAELEYAARGGATRASRFWWGDELRPGGRWMANIFTGSFPHDDTAEDGYAGTSPVRAFPANAYGLYDMAGNVWQWTSDLYRMDAHVRAREELEETGASCHVDPKGPPNSFNPAREVPSSPERVLKGGSFLCHASYCESYRPPARRGMPADTSTSHVGFRCARSG